MKNKFGSQQIYGLKLSAKQGAILAKKISFEVSHELIYGLKLSPKQSAILAKKVNFDLSLEEEDQTAFRPDHLVALTNFPEDGGSIVLTSRKAIDYNDNVKQIPSHDLTVRELFNNDIIKYCKKHQVPCNPSKIGWHLISYAF